MSKIPLKTSRPGPSWVPCRPWSSGEPLAFFRCYSLSSANPQGHLRNEFYLWASPWETHLNSTDELKTLVGTHQEPQVIMCCTFLFIERGALMEGKELKLNAEVAPLSLQCGFRVWGTLEPCTIMLWAWGFIQNWRNGSPVLGSHISISYWHQHLSFGKRGLRAGKSKPGAELRFIVSSQAFWSLLHQDSGISITHSGQGPLDDACTSSLFNKKAFYMWWRKLSLTKVFFFIACLWCGFQMPACVSHFVGR